MGTLEERIREFMDATGWDVPKIATVGGVSPSAVWQWLGKSSKLIKTIGRLDVALKLERESGFSALWLARGEGPKMVERPRGTEASAWETIRRARRIVEAASESRRTSIAELMRAYLVAPEEDEAIVSAICALLEEDGSKPSPSSKRRAA